MDHPNKAVEKAYRQWQAADKKARAWRKKAHEAQAAASAWNGAARRREALYVAIKLAAEREAKS